MEQQETTRGQRIADAFSYLRKSGIVKTQQEIADMMGANKTTRPSPELWVMGVTA